MGLNAKQKEAVEYLEGPLLVLAGPGTGKTQLLSEKVAYILENTDTSPENILCLTFTESGTTNMHERLKSIIGPVATKVNINTYHAFGSEILAYYKNYSESSTKSLNLKSSKTSRANYPVQIFCAATTLKILSTLCLPPNPPASPQQTSR